MCTHQNIHCINQYELIRKYKCTDCSAVMMCACDEEIGRKFLPHQLAFGQSYETKEDVPINHGFLKNICDECRGLLPKPYPVGSIFGRTSNIKRYYWRELAFREYKIYEELGGNPETYLYELGESEPKIIRTAREQALIDIKALHSENPKYRYDQESNESFLKRLSVPMRTEGGTFIKGEERKAKIAYKDETLTVEQYAQKIYEDLGYKVLHLESMPFHALFGVFNWLLIKDPSDPEVQLSGFGKCSAYEADGSKQPIWVPLPSDFGSSGYAKRRSKEIEDHLSELAGHTEDLIWLFDYWTPYSEGLRQYLWAHRIETVQTARKLVEILESKVIVEILRYLLGNYWQRYLGWPDLLVYNSDSYLFVEVKLSKDKLSEEQRQWVENNKAMLQLPYEILKVNRVAAQQNHAADNHSATPRVGG